METITTTIPPEYFNRYLPYTEGEYIELKSIMKDITSHIPNDKMDWVWGNHNRILKTNEAQPGSCGRASNLWIRATETIRNFIINVEKNA